MRETERQRERDRERETDNERETERERVNVDKYVINIALLIALFPASETSY